MLAAPILPDLAPSRPVPAEGFLATPDPSFDPVAEQLRQGVQAGNIEDVRAALKQGANPNAMFPVGVHRSLEPVLVQRWVRGAVRLPIGPEQVLVALLINAGAALNARSAEGHRSLLDDASQTSAWGAVIALLDAGADLPENTLAPGGWLSGLMEREAPLDVLRRVLNQTDPDPSVAHRLLHEHLRAVQPPGHPANLELVDALLELDALVANTTPVVRSVPGRPLWIDRTPLMALAAQRGEIKVIERLARAGEPATERFTRAVHGLTSRHHISSWFNPDWTALHLAAEANQAAACEALLALGADPTVRTALPWTEKEALQRMATQLVPMPMPEKPGVPGYTPMDLALLGGGHEAAAVLERHALRQSLQQDGENAEKTSAGTQGRSRTRL